MSGLNLVIIEGRLGQDPELKHTANGTAVVNISVATSYKPKDGDEQTEWHKITAWSRNAEVISEFLRKGSQATFVGRIQTRKWEDKDGSTRYATEIVADRVVLGARADSTNAESAPASEPPEPDDPSDDLPF